MAAQQSVCAVVIDTAPAEGPSIAYSYPSSTPERFALLLAASRTALCHVTPHGHPATELELEGGERVGYAQEGPIVVAVVVPPNVVRAAWLAHTCLGAVSLCLGPALEAGVRDGSAAATLSSVFGRVLSSLQSDPSASMLCSTLPAARLADVSSECREEIQVRLNEFQKAKYDSTLVGA
eukprot:m51a1_g5993 hypothetical protein (179) ;mRNA; r:285653-286299